jgi:cytochrome c553
MTAFNKPTDSSKVIVIAILSGLLVVGFGFGFLVLPRFQQGHEKSAMGGIDNALGFHHHQHVANRTVAAPQVPTYIVWNESTIHEALGGDIARGEFVAFNCSACHGEKGTSSQPWIPNLAGMDRLVLYKQLADFRSGTRNSGPMSAIAQSLTAQQSADVAAYFASLRGGAPPTSGLRTPESGRSYHAADATKRLIFAGDPKRGIAGCATCHGPGGYRLGAPALARQNAAYIEQQLQNFAQGIRRNDMNMPMRTIAPLMKPDEIHALALAYGNATLQ